MISSDSGQESQELLCTPRRSQKRFFGNSGSIIKRSLFQQEYHGKENDINSGDESDLGPMSPLALTNGSPSSTSSSPGRQFVSPLATPEGSPQIPVMKATWDRLIPGSLLSEKRISPFSTLKHLTRKARSSPRRKIFPDSPKSTGSPRRFVNSPLCTDELIPETPLRSGSEQNENHVEETPQKEFTEQRMITPLGSVNKDVSLPRLHRRKTLGSFDIDEISPEKTGISAKRHINDSNVVGSKLQKTDEACSIPKARASLFQDNQNTSMTVDTKSFYGSGRRDRLNAFGIDWKQYDESKKRRSLPNPRSHRRSRKTEMNSGVSHGIKKPRAKKHVSRIESFKKKEEIISNWNNRAEAKITKVEPAKSIPKTKGDSNKQLKVNFDFWNKEQEPKKTDAVIDPTKRFFKTVRQKRARVASKLNDSLPEKNIHKKPKMDISLDANDLTVDEPDLETRKKDVDDLLKILEDDWTDDEYEPMETVIRKQFQDSPNFQDAMMSPASELSNMTSIMNIDDKDEGKNSKILSLKSYGKAKSATNHSSMNIEDNETQQESLIENLEKTETVKYYPLFTKGYSSRENISSPKSKKATLCQLTKAGGGSDQYQIDCGQKKFGATQCNECGIVYQMGDPQDENAHLNYHNSTKTLKFQGWKNERVIWDDEATTSRIILIDPYDNKQHWKKVTEILNVVDADLGLVDMQLSYYRDKKVYLYVRDRNVLGVLVVESVKEAHRMIPELMDLDCCSSESTPVKCGVNVVWTALSHRRKGIATQLLDTLRRNYFYGYIMAIDDVAFSTPTPSGKLFALKYTKTENFLVYS
ncbi:N-acetyltransferase ESCO2 [Leptopilina boulardi]|uniref:N-acetyltransferase ESCO2 n=1 Tax=Leptopilina boulardi TaxID=63433 RepID=UPI0021F66869|nr:N-acetyltransferase ESCO2 [Leptopilina boulardi]